VSRDSQLDHLTVAVATLAEGVEWVFECLGVTPVAGGAHPRMGTHNALVRLGDAAFLEVIAIDSKAANPGRPRWFALDDPAMRVRLQKGPSLIAWVVRTHDLRTIPPALLGMFGAVERVSRGDLDWLITIAPDGSLAEDGALPALIEWPLDGAHPAATLPEAGCALLEFEVRHPNALRVAAALESIGFESSVTALKATSGRSASLSARIQTPHGVRVISSDGRAGGNGAGAANHMGGGSLA